VFGFQSSWKCSRRGTLDARIAEESSGRAEGRKEFRSHLPFFRPSRDSPPGDRRSGGVVGRYRLRVDRYPPVVMGDPCGVRLFLHVVLLDPGEVRHCRPAVRHDPGGVSRNRPAVQCEHQGVHREPWGVRRYRPVVNRQPPVVNRRPPVARRYGRGAAHGGGGGGDSRRSKGATCLAIADDGAGEVVFQTFVVLFDEADRGFRRGGDEGARAAALSPEVVGDGGPGVVEGVLDAEGSAASDAHGQGGGALYPSFFAGARCPASATSSVADGFMAKTRRPPSWGGAPRRSSPPPPCSGR